MKRGDDWPRPGCYHAAIVLASIGPGVKQSPDGVDQHRNQPWPSILHTYQFICLASPSSLRPTFQPSVPRVKYTAEALAAVELLGRPGERLGTPPRRVRRHHLAARLHRGQFERVLAQELDRARPSGCRAGSSALQIGPDDPPGEPCRARLPKRSTSSERIQGHIPALQPDIRTHWQPTQLGAQRPGKARQPLVSDACADGPQRRASSGDHNVVPRRRGTSPPCSSRHHGTHSSVPFA